MKPNKVYIAQLKQVLARYEIAHENLKEIAGIASEIGNEEILELCDGVTANEYALDDIEEAYFLLDNPGLYEEKGYDYEQERLEQVNRRRLENDTPD